MESNVRVVTDSGSDLPQDLVDEHGITIVPLTIRFGDEELIDREELSNDEFWKRLSESPDLPSTAAPSPGAFEKAFLEASSRAGGLVCITLSSRLSATYQAAVTAAEMVRGRVDVRVIDSLSASVGEGLLCIEAARLAREGASLEQITAAVDGWITRMKVYGALDTLDNLRKGGRIGAAGAFFGSLLSVKPLITFKDGEVRPESRQRTRSRALGRLVELVREQGDVEHIAVADAGDDIETFLSMLGPLGRGEDLICAKVGPVIGTHGGRGVTAVAVIPREASQ